MLSANNTVSWTKKHSLLSKWNLLFDKSPEWISFKPQPGLKVYPCYACKNMFSSKLTFQDHINRRVIIVKYKCINCTNTLTFYNRCSFLLHTRKHYTLAEGVVNLSHVDIMLLPVELAGFDRHENIPFLYDEEEEYITDNVYMNSQFYTPDDSEAGKQIITLRPYNLVFHYTENGNNILMVLKQISSNVPLCEFIVQDYNQKNNPVAEIEDMERSILEPEIKLEPDTEEFTIPIISKIESLNNDADSLKFCSECMSIPDGPMAAHFYGENKPLNENLFCYICKYIAPTKCSLKAHTRTHEKAPPFVCPDCGQVFNRYQLLHDHMEEVCFHLTKQVRFRCPALKCGKLFVLPNTYAAHFANHIQCIQQCSICNSGFYNETTFQEHTKTHETPSTLIKTYNCVVCKNMPILPEDKYSEHLNWHLQDRERCVYIFQCKCCRSYFRSKTTYAVHKQRCSKSEKSQPTQIMVNCHFCAQKIVFREKDNFKTCSICKLVNHSPFNSNKSIAGPQDEKKPSASGEEKKVTCVLCKEELCQEEKRSHSKICKYINPVVTIKSMSNDSRDASETSLSEKFSTTNSDVESKLSNLDTSNESNKTDENQRKKRKRPSGLNMKNKKLPPSEDTADLQAEEPVSFDGTYYCKLCDYKNADRTEFHSHIITHRDVSTAYQCMECGECFVVKPSLIKHLLHYHKITDTNSYLSKNDCYDKSAIEELENQLKLVPGEHKGPLKENQCTVCLEQFEDAIALNKHFRIHGMAFLMKNK